MFSTLCTHFLYVFMRELFVLFFSGVGDGLGSDVELFLCWSDVDSFLSIGGGVLGGWLHVSLIQSNVTSFICFFFPAFFNSI